MTKKIVIAALLCTAAALARAGVGCTTSDVPVYLTDCTWNNPDAGANGTPYACSIEWTCNSATDHFFLDCNTNPNLTFSCTCTTDTTTNMTPIAVDQFPCDGVHGLPPATEQVPGGCGWLIELAASQ